MKKTELEQFQMFLRIVEAMDAGRFTEVKLIDRVIRETTQIKYVQAMVERQRLEGDKTEVLTLPD